MNKKKLYESIMKSVSKQIKRALNESTQTSNIFYIGDPCYILPENIYNDVWGEQNDFANGEITDGETIYGVVNGTAYGDGEYTSDSNFSYTVDSGTLAIIPAIYADPRKVKMYAKLINIFEYPFTDDIEIIDNDGELEFYIDGECVETIYTNYNDEEDEYEDEYDEYDEYEDEEDEW